MLTDDARAFEALFRATYLRFHRRDGKAAALPGASLAVLHHLSLAGPVTIGEAARHLDRAQSVVSEIVDGLVEKGLLERQRDPGDRRRTLVWLTDAGVDRLRREHEVLSTELVETAMRELPEGGRAALHASLRALVDAAPARLPPSEKDDPTEPEGERR